MEPIPHLQSPGFRRHRRAGMALVIILAFVVILTGVIIAFFSRAITNRSISNASASQSKVDLLAAGAADSIIGDLQQEIVLTSTATPAITGTGVTYIPLTSASMLPQLSGTTSNATGLPPNLLKRSAYDYSAAQPVPFLSANASNQATASIPGVTINVSSTTPSLNGRSISMARWNAHYLLPLASSTDSTPITTGSTAFTPPDWVLVTRNGQPATKWSPSMATSATNGNMVIGRYAYAIYHEGGLLDANVAGYPVGNGAPPATGTTQYSYKPALAYADLTQIGLTQTQVDQLVAWRNYASAQTPGSSFLTPNFTSASGSSYYNFVLNNPAGFLTVTGTSLNNNGVMSQTSGQSDRMFESRQEFIAFMQRGLGLSGTSLNVLNYLATFTRGLDQPSFSPDPSRPLISSTAHYAGNNAYGYDNQINPSFLTIRVVSPGFTRNDGHTALPGDPLVNKRFPLQKLAWITYLGPSATRNLTSPSQTGQDADIWALENTYGIPASYLAQGTASNIANYFGLVWQKDTMPSGTTSFHDNQYKWFYTGHNTPAGGKPGTLTSPNTSGAISQLANIALLGSNAREPDFFELLKASVNAGSVAKGAIDLTGTSIIGLGAFHPYNIQTLRDISLDYAIIQLGTNIIEQTCCDGYPKRIVFNDGTKAHEFRGVDNEPYLYRVETGTLKLRMEAPQESYGNVNTPAAELQDTGVGMIVHVPEIWNPHDENAPMGNPRPTNFRLVADSTDPDDIDNNNTATGYTSFGAMGSDPNGANQTPSNGNAVTSTVGTVGVQVPPFSTGFLGTGSLISTGVNPVIPRPLTPLNTALTFSVPASTTGTTLFREPTLLARPGIPTGSNLQIGWNISTDPDLPKITNSANKVALQSGTSGFISETPNPLNLPTAPAKTQPYLGIFLGLYPIAWVGPRWPNVTPTTDRSIRRSDWAGLVTNPAGFSYLTYRLQYQDPNSTDPTNGWVTYDEKYTSILTLFMLTALGSNAGELMQVPESTAGYNYTVGGATWQSYLDPRTARFCALEGPNLDHNIAPPGGTTGVEWVDPANDVLYTDRPDLNSGYAVADSIANIYSDVFYTNHASGWTVFQNYFRPGLITQNSITAIDNGIRFTGDSAANKETSGGAEYYADPDGIVRGSMGTYVNATSGFPASTAVGIPSVLAYPPTTPPANQGQSRPYILHRPFRSVAELGYVFSGTPWKNVDFFTAQSGDAPVLDVFTVAEPPTQETNSTELVAGTVDLNTKQVPVLQAVLAGAYTGESPADIATAHPFTGGPAGEAALILTATNGLISRTASTTAGQGPLQNTSELVGRWVSSMGAYSGPVTDLTSIYGSIYSGPTLQVMQNIQRFREGFVRPLAAVGNTRVWNLLIDIIAQTGRYPQSTTNPSYFMVDGEQRYWVHVAIDRLTGQILDKQVEVVKE